MNSSTPTNNGIAALSTRGWVSLNQFSKIVGVSYPTAQKLVKNNHVETIRVGSTIRVYTDEVRRFLKEGNKVQNEGSNTPHSS